MRFDSSERLAFLAVAVALVLGYGAMLWHRRRAAKTFASPALLPLVAPRRQPRSRHVVALGFLAALVLATLGAAQPTVAGVIKKKTATIIVAIDVSDSMAATDVTPNRITAATRAARSFVRDLPDGFEVGLVTAGPAPAVVVPPTLDHASVERALGSLELHPGTALGEAIFASLGAIPKPATTTAKQSGAIVLLSDGKTTTGRPDAEGIAAAKQRKIPVSTIAFGTNNASVVSQGVTVQVPVDKTALRAIAEGTGGTFFQAASAAQLRSVYDKVDAQVTVTNGRRDLSSYFAAGALLLLFVAVAASLASTGRPAFA